MIIAKSEPKFSTGAATNTKLSRSILFRFDQVMANQAALFMDAKSLNRVLSASKTTLILFRQSWDNKRLSELLRHVLNANAETVSALLHSLSSSLPPSLPKFSNNENIVLKKSCGKEEYENSNTKTMIFKRVWKDISPLEAAALTGDNFLVKELLKYIPTKLRNEAAEQLQGILNRTAKDENGVYLAPLKALIKAYNDFMDQYDILYAANDWDKLDELWIKGVGVCQRLLSTYVLQEFLNRRFDRRFLPSFDREPYRSCRNRYLYPDLEGIGVSVSLYKGNGPRGFDYSNYWSTVMALCVKDIQPQGVGMDLQDMSILCNVRTVELEEIIKLLLQEPAKAVNTINSQQDCCVIL